MRIAAIADIHGNLPALDAVLADIAACGADVTVNLGDIVSGPLWPVETAERLMPLGLPTIASNHERQVLTQPLTAMSATDAHTRRCLEDRHLDWLATVMPDFGRNGSVENGTPHARWALLTRASTEWHVDWRAVPYDWAAAARQAEHHGRPDWSHALRTGRVPAIAAS